MLDAGADRDEVRAGLLDVPGIGPWTADYVLMRGLGDPDVFLPTDLGVKVGLDVVGARRRARRALARRGGPTPCTTCGPRAQTRPSDARPRSEAA